MKRTISLFALCCLVLFGFGCNNPDPLGAKKDASTAIPQETCQPAIYYACGTCDDGSQAWKQCNDDGKTFAVCTCPTPAPKPDASAPTPTSTVTSTSTGTATSSATATQSATVTQIIVVVVTPDAGADAPSLSGCPHAGITLPSGSIRPCGYELGECRTGTQVCNGIEWSECSGGVFPAAEVCDGKDNDCNGRLDDGQAMVCACDPIKGPERPCGGHNNVGTCKAGKQQCLSTGNGFVWSTECKGEVLPQPETCNLQDDDCDGAVDNGFNLNAACLGIGECGTGKIECDFATGAAKCSTRFGGTNYRPVPEICDGKDNDCDGRTDEDFFVSTPCNGTGACFFPPGVYECDGNYGYKCSTGPEGSNSKATAEVCFDIIDNNCDGIVNESCECTNGNPRTCGPTKDDGSPNQTGECRNEIQVCSGGKWPTTCPKAVFPSPELCDGKDNDCDGLTDEDYGLGTVCQGIGECGAGVIECNPQTNGTRCSTQAGGSQFHPMPELCDGKDNDCDGRADEDYHVSIPCIGMGACAASPGIYECDGLQSYKCSVGATGSQSKATVEICSDKVDNDCDGVVNQGCKCDDNETRLCGPTKVDGSLNQTGECRAVMQTCVNGTWPDICSGAINPSPELCDGKDNDCDEAADEDFDKQTDENNCGFCGFVCSFANASAVCQGGVCTLGVCDDNYYDRNASAADGCETGCMPTRNGVEYCDSIDNDCNGVIDVDAVATVESDPMNCGACGNICALPNVALNGCSDGVCTILHCLPGWTDVTVEPGCETPVVPPSGTGGSAGTGGITETGGVIGTGGSVGTGGDIGTGGAVGTGGSTVLTTGGTIGTGGSVGTGGNIDTGGNTGIDGGIIADGGVVIPPSMGTIVCTLTGATMTIAVNGIVSLGLDSELPAGSISSLALGMDWGTCWPANGNPAGCFQQAVDPNTVDSTVHTWTDVPQTRFTPRVTSSAWFQLRYWTILGDCIREGCGFCRPGEVCWPTLEPPDGCIAKAKPPITTDGGT